MRTEDLLTLKEFLSASRTLLNSSISGESQVSIPRSLLAKRLSESFEGFYVSLYSDHEPRGCLGRHELKEVSGALVLALALAAARDDERYRRISADELSNIDIGFGL